MTDPTADLIDGFDAVLADLDGVVYAGPEAIPGAVEALGRLAERRIRLGYVTNNASRAPAAVAAHLRELGAPADDDQVVSSAQAGAALLAQRYPAGSKVLVVGAAALVHEVELVGMVPVAGAGDRPAVVIQGFDPDMGWKDLAEAAYALNGGADWIATNTDLTIPRDRGIAPGNGAMVDAVRSAVDKEPLVAGKPEAPLFHTAARRLDATTPLVVGDRLDTDIRGGNNAAMATALVLTGIDSAATALAAAAADRPTYLLSGLADLYRPYPAIGQANGAGDGSTFTCGKATARVVDGGLQITGSDTDLDAWRAACAAWWNHVPDAEAATAPVLSWRDGSRHG